MMYKYTMDGAPRLLNFKPSRAMLAAMQSGMRASVADKDAASDRIAIAYATHVLARRGVTVPVICSTVQCRIERDAIADTSLPWRERYRPRFVHWAKGGKRDQYATGGGKRRRQIYIGRKWEEDKILLTFEIPHWDFVPKTFD